MTFIDSHCHLPDIKHKKALEQILQEAQKEGVTKFINIGTSVKHNKKALKTAKNYLNVSATAAVYPHEDQNKSLKEIKTYLQNYIEINKKDLVGIGETGIDITSWKNGRSKKEQIELFEFQAHLAKEYDLPLIVHNRNGDKEVLQVLKNVKVPKGVIHCFASKWDFAKEVLDLGFYISFSGLITYKSRDYLLETVKKVPNDRFLIGTDAPLLPPEGHRGEQNQPKYVKIIAQKVADVKGLSLEQVAKFSTSNAEELFDL
ncbi:YchF/TatD family DNA exonuclease [candidate division WWE3 bacterium]|nr:YchF/TatD family DNA exonuclease [candidate division WWE3 bacterium]